MIYLFALLIVSLLGFLLIRLLTAGRMNLYLTLCLGTSLGLGVVSQMIFYLQLVGNSFNHFIPPLLSIVLVVVLFILNQKYKIPFQHAPKNLTLLVLLFLAIPLCLEANFFPMGGWDAWSCWNLKAKFIYLGEDNWKDLFNPVLWRSNTQYPLALPTINVWFWNWSGFAQFIPMLNSVLLTLLTAGTLLLGLQELKVKAWVSAVITMAVFTLSFGNTLCISQYSDILFSLYLLCAFVCYLLYKIRKDSGLLIVTAIFIGLLSFTKNEGLAASAILTLLIAIERPLKPAKAIAALVLAAIPSIIFVLSMAPHNEAFVNGLTSAAKPSSGERLMYILAYTGVEFVSLKWNGLWILAALGLGFGAAKAFKRPLAIIGLFVGLYLAVVLAYYQVNTFFEIGWWMQNTLNRIIFVLMPSVFLWMGLSVFTDPKRK